MKLHNLFEKNQGTALFMALMILSGVLVVSLGAANLINLGIRQSRIQVYSTKAYFAAEAGAERVLWEIRKNGFNPSSCVENVDYVIFDNDNFPPNTAVCGSEQINSLFNNATYSVFYKLSSPITFESIGRFQDAKRSVEVSY